MRMSKIVPALTREEWATFLAGNPVLNLDGAGFQDCPHIQTEHGGEVIVAVEDVYLGLSGIARHAGCATLLHGQPFGFTREDVEALRQDGWGYDEVHDQAKLDDLADRIEALLPPEDL